MSAVQAPIDSILTINAGSSSIKFALLPISGLPGRSLWGNIDRIGQPGCSLTLHRLNEDHPLHRDLECAGYPAATEFLVGWLAEQIDFASVKALGHRVVHGMHYSEPMLVTEAVLAELHRISPYDPAHLPQETALIEAFRQRYPDLPQVACFDTAFHRHMPRVARILPIPRRFDAEGVQRYGFHGLSCAWLMEELARAGGPVEASGRVILAHLGSGASMTAVHHGVGIDTSMGFTPAGGLPMSTRSGDLDPGVSWYLMSDGARTPSHFNHLINHECGLRGISETSGDMRDLLSCQATDVRAAEAVEVFCYQARKWIGAFAAALGGLETLVFSGGIGEHAAEVRWRICDGLQFLGIDLDEARNTENLPLISGEASRVKVRVIPTDEESMIALQVRRLLSSQESSNA